MITHTFETDRANPNRLGLSKNIAESFALLLDNPIWICLIIKRLWVCSEYNITVNDYQRDEKPVSVGLGTLD